MGGHSPGLTGGNLEADSGVASCTHLHYNKDSDLVAREYFRSMEMEVWYLEYLSNPV